MCHAKPAESEPYKSEAQATTVVEKFLHNEIIFLAQSIGKILKYS